MKIASIVEGDGEVVAVPVLLRRLAQWRTPGQVPQILPPIRVRRDRFLNRDDEFRRHILLASSKCGEGGWILVLLDADDDCPMTLGETTLQRARHCVPHRAVSVVLVNREYEAWFIAAAASLDGYRGFSLRAGDHFVEPETPRNAKGWIRDRMASGAYGETTDQSHFTARFDLSQAFDRSRSFRKLCSEWDKHHA